MKLNLTQRFATNAGSQMVGRALVVVASLVTVALITRYLGAAGYGRYATAFALVGLVGIAIDLGLYLVIVRVISTHERRPEEVVSNVIGLRLALFAAAFLVILIATFALPYDSTTRAAVLVGSLSLLGISLNQVLGGVFQAHLRMDLFVAGDVAGRVLTLLISWWVLASGGGLIGVTWAVVAGYAFNLILTYVLVRPYLSFGIRFNLRVWRWILKEGIPLGILIVLAALYLRLDVFLLSLFRPATEVGSYAVAAKIAEVLTGFGLILMGGALPLISAALAERARDKVSRVQTEAYDLLLALGAGLVVGGLFTGPKLVELIAGEGFDPAVLPLQILLAAVALGFLSTFFSQLMVAHGEQRRLIRPTLIAVAASLVLNLIFIPRFGPLGAAVTLVVSEALLLAGYARLTRSVTGFRLPEGRFGRLFVSLLVLSVVLFLLRDASLMLMLVLGGATYLAALAGSGLIRRERLRELSRRA